MRAVVDYFLPQNCRKELYAAAEALAVECNETVCFLQGHREKIHKELKDDKTRAA